MQLASCCNEFSELRRAASAHDTAAHALQDGLKQFDIGSHDLSLPTSIVFMVQTELFMVLTAKTSVRSTTAIYFFPN